MLEVKGLRCPNGVKWKLGGSVFMSNRFQVIHKAGVVPVTIKKTFMLHTNHKRDPESNLSVLFNL